MNHASSIQTQRVKTLRNQSATMHAETDTPIRTSESTRTGKARKPIKIALSNLLQHQILVHRTGAAVGFESVYQAGAARNRRDQAAHFLIGEMVAVAPGAFDVFPAQQVIALVERIRRKAERFACLRVRDMSLRRQRGVIHELPKRHGHASSRTHCINQPVQHAHAQLFAWHMVQKAERHGHVDLRRMMQLAQRRARDQTAHDV